MNKLVGYKEDTNGKMVHVHTLRVLNFIWKQPNSSCFCNYSTPSADLCRLDKYFATYARRDTLQATGYRRLSLVRSVQQVRAEIRLPIYQLAPEHFSDLCFPLYRRPRINQLQVLFLTTSFGKSTLPFAVPVRMCCDAATRTPLLLLVNLQSVFFAFSLCK